MGKEKFLKMLTAYYNAISIADTINQAIQEERGADSAMAENRKYFASILPMIERGINNATTEVMENRLAGGSVSDWE